MDVKNLTGKVSGFFRRKLIPGVRLRPHDLIELKGLDSSFEGNYYIDSVDHRTSSEGYKVTFITVRPHIRGPRLNNDNP